VNVYYPGPVGCSDGFDLTQDSYSIDHNHCFRGETFDDGRDVFGNPKAPGSAIKSFTETLHSAAFRLELLGSFFDELIGLDGVRSKPKRQLAAKSSLPNCDPSGQQNDELRHDSFLTSLVE
jgi:hypothetical protein